MDLLFLIIGEPVVEITAEAGCLLLGAISRAARQDGLALGGVPDQFVLGFIGRALRGNDFADS